MLKRLFSRLFPCLSPLESALPPPSSPRPTPFSTLPFELVEEIIHCTVPLHYNSSTYRERQRILLPLCLVSRLFCQIAQPFLCSSMQIDTSWRTTRCSGWKRKYLGRILCREFAVVTYARDLEDWKVEQIMGTEVFLKVLVIVQCESLDFALLSSAPNLSTLIVVRTTFVASKTVNFPRLVELSLHRVSTNYSFGNNVNEHSFPSLRAYAAHESYWLDPNVSSIILSTQAPFEIISLDVYAAMTLPSLLLEKVRLKTLLDHDRLDHPLANSFKSLRLPELRFWPTNLHRFAQTISRIPPPSFPSLLYVPRYEAHDIQTLIEMYSRDGFTQTKRTSLATLFENPEIEVIFEDCMGREDSDMGFSPDFWRRMRRQAEDVSLREEE